MGIISRLTHPGVLLIAIGLLALGLKRVNGASPRHIRLPFEATLAGVSGGGSVWEGPLHGARGGKVQLTLYQVESPLEAARPVWHARAQWTVAADSPERSFTAELEGMVDWKSGATHLSGVVTSGWMKGAWVQQIGQSVNGDMSGVLELAPGVALSKGAGINLFPGHDGKPRS